MMVGPPVRVGSAECGARGIPPRQPELMSAPDLKGPGSWYEVFVDKESRCACN